MARESSPAETKPMSESTRPETTWIRVAWRAPMIAACAVLALVAFAQVLGWRANRDRLLVDLRGNDVATAAVEREIRREVTPHHAKIDAARALVFHLLEAPPLTGALPDVRAVELASRRDRLDRARALAREGLAAQPNSWQAAMLIGATTYLDWSMSQDPRLFLEAAAWQEPLLKALREAPAAREPRRILASAYLELWPALAPERRVFARELLGSVFIEDPDAFERLGPVWFEVADDIDEAFSLVPPTPKAWRQVQADLAEAGRLRLFVRARALHLDSLQDALQERLDEAITRKTFGNPFHSRTRFARVLADAPTDLRFAPMIDQVLANYPPGLQPSGTGGAMDRWLRWALDWSEVWIFPLEPSNLRRLSAAAKRPDPPDAARAALLGGELPLAERLERLESQLDGPEWSAYLEAKAFALLERNLPREAGIALTSMDLESRNTATYALLRLRIAQALEDADGLAIARRLVERHRRQSWPRSAWVARGDTWYLDLLPSVAGRGLSIEGLGIPESGAVLRIEVDGRGVREVAMRRDATLTLEVELEPDRPHRVVWHTLVGRGARPGAVRLRR